MSSKPDQLHAKYGVGRHDAAYHMIREAILAGRIPQGEQLNERSLGERFGVSRTPIRHALARLAGEGVVEQVPHVGAFVRKLSVSESIELVEFRRGIESACAAMAALKGTPKDLDALRDLAMEINVSDDALRKARDTDRERDAVVRDRETEITFHHRVAEVARNAEMLRVVDNASVLYLTLFPDMAVMDFLKREAGSVADHVAVAAAIGSGDPTAAFKAMWEHFGPALKWTNSEASKVGPGGLSGPASVAGAEATADKRP